MNGVGIIREQLHGGSGAYASFRKMFYPVTQFTSDHYEESWGSIDMSQMVVLH